MYRLVAYAEIKINRYYFVLISYGPFVDDFVEQYILF